MKRIIWLFIGVLIIYLFLKFVLHDFMLGHDIDYQIKNKKNTFEIKEILNLKKDQGQTNYYFEITKNKQKFIFKTANEFKKDMKVIENIEYFKNDKYECILPIFKDDKVVIDMMCYYQDQLYFNYSLPEKDQELKDFIKSLKNYESNNWSDSKKDFKTTGSVTLYENNILENHFIALDNYRGIYIIDSLNTITNVKLFKEDVYETQIKGLVNENYIIADYDEKHDFNQFYIVNLTNQKKSEMIVNYDINFDSFVNGTYKDSLFLLDKEAKTQYEINVKSEEATVAGTTKTGAVIYNDEEKEIIKMNQALKQETKFNTITKDKKYVRIDELAGNYYLYEKQDDVYHVYKAPIEDKKQTIYLFSTTNIEEISYIDNYIYFRLNNDVLYYHDNLGVKTLFSDREYEFNKHLKYYIFVEV